MIPSPAELVARFLRANGYDHTLNTFIEEAGLRPDAGSAVGVTIEQIVDEKKTFDLSLSFEKLGTDDDQRWCTPAPSNAIVLDTLPTKTNILSTHLLRLILPGSTEPRPCIAATTADRRLNLFDPLTPSFPLLHSHVHIQDSPILDLVVIDSKFMLVASMSGRLVIYNTATNQITDERRDHAKYLVKLATWSGGDHTYVASAGWDLKVHLYRFRATDDENASLGDPLATLTVPSTPETILFLEVPGKSAPVLLLTRRDSTFLYYYELSDLASDAYEMTLLGKQNLAPQSNAWIAFSPSDVQLCPTDNSKVAVATSSTPHMKLLIVRLLVPPGRPSDIYAAPHMSEQASTTSTRRALDPTETNAPLTQASQRREQLLINDREEAAIIINVNTMAPQTAYSTPKLVWRPDGSGIYVTSDDGVVRGFEASTGKLIKSLHGHQSGSKVRCLWAGSLGGEAVSDSDLREECLISGGFDQKVILWKSL